MPIISVFFGIIVRMYYKEHEPEHFHAEHQGQQGKFDFSGKMTIGKHPIRDGVAIDQRMGGVASGRTAGKLEADEGGPTAQRHCTS